MRPSPMPSRGSPPDSTDDPPIVTPVSSESCHLIARHPQRDGGGTRGMAETARVTAPNSNCLHPREGAGDQRKRRGAHSSFCACQGFQAADEPRPIPNGPRELALSGHSLEPVVLEAVRPVGGGIDYRVRLLYDTRTKRSCRQKEVKEDPGPSGRSIPTFRKEQEARRRKVPIDSNHDTQQPSCPTSGWRCAPSPPSSTSGPRRI